MTTDSKVTAAEVLLGSGANATSLPELLGPPQLGESTLRGVQALTAGTRNVVEREITSAASSFLNIDLGDVLLGGWLRYHELRSAAVRTQNGGREVVPLARHRVTATHRPWIELRAGEVPIGRVDFELTMTLRLDGVVAVVAGAALVEARFGECTASVTLAVTRHGQVAQRSRTLPVWQVLELRSPIALLGSHNQRTAQAR